MAEDRGVEPHPISENLVFKASRRTIPAALTSINLGTERRDRTAHTLFFKQVLYQLSYLGNFLWGDLWDLNPSYRIHNPRC